MANPLQMYMPASTLAGNLPSESNCFLSPKDASKIIGLSVDWLAAAREGRKDVEGPPYIKIGKGKTAPIRYKLSSLQTWVDQFEEIVNSAGARPALRRSFSDFTKIGNSGDAWLFAINAETLTSMEFFEAVKTDNLSSKTVLRWVSYDDAMNQRLFAERLNFSADTYRILVEAGDGDPTIGLQILTTGKPW